MKNKNIIEISENRFYQMIEECVMNVLNEGYGWDIFKKSVKDGWSNDGKSVSDNSDYNIGRSVSRVIKGNPNPNYTKKAYHTVKSKDPNISEKSATRHKYNALYHEPGISGEIKRGAAAAGLIGGATARAVHDGVKNGISNARHAVNSKIGKIKGQGRNRKANRNDNGGFEL